MNFIEEKLQLISMKVELIMKLQVRIEADLKAVENNMEEIKQLGKELRESGVLLSDLWGSEDV